MSKSKWSLSLASHHTRHPCSWSAASTRTHSRKKTLGLGIIETRTGALMCSLLQMEGLLLPCFRETTRTRYWRLLGHVLIRSTNSPLSCQIGCLWHTCRTSNFSKLTSSPHRFTARQTRCLSYRRLPWSHPNSAPSSKLTSSHKYSMDYSVRMSASSSHIQCSLRKYQLWKKRNERLRQRSKRFLRVRKGSLDSGGVRSGGWTRRCINFENLPMVAKNTYSKTRKLNRLKHN